MLFKTGSSPLIPIPSKRLPYDIGIQKRREGTIPMRKYGAYIVDSSRCCAPARLRLFSRSLHAELFPTSHAELPFSSPRCSINFREMVEDAAFSGGGKMILVGGKTKILLPPDEARVRAVAEIVQSLINSIRDGKVCRWWTHGFHAWQVPCSPCDQVLTSVHLCEGCGPEQS